MTCDSQTNGSGTRSTRSLTSSCPRHGATRHESRVGPRSREVVASRFPTHIAREASFRFPRNSFRCLQIPSIPRNRCDRPSETLRTAGLRKMPAWDDVRANVPHGAQIFRPSFVRTRVPPRPARTASGSLCLELIRDRFSKRKWQACRWFSFLCRPVQLRRVPPRNFRPDRPSPSAVPRKN